MNNVLNQSVDDFLVSTASADPTPGGGSVAAVAGTLAAALVQMVGNLTVGKEQYRNVESEVQQLVENGSKLLVQLKELAAEDMAHFSTFMQILKMPKETSEQIARRTEEMQKALVMATKTPLAIAAAGVEILTIACRLAEIGTKTAVSDNGVAACLAEAAVQAALITADCNLSSIKDVNFLHWAQEEKQKLSNQAIQLKEKTLAYMRQRM